ncbi:unnamed protein product [Rotaria sordida]|uniref:SWIM-type domain-containing protein n=1 Tax=Rotaria sordida TaxID=392033 RepID=A0A819YE53_9BILA|nr:unnamed protein product [Rotaria sordida]CAF4157227.1 unnamed protein product [Rotaria sordida]
MAIECVCCNTRIDSKNYRPFRGIAMRLFVSARTNMYLPDSGSICNACRMSYLKWRNNTEFISVLNRLEEEPNESIMDIDDKNDDDNNESVIAAPSNDAVGTNVVTLPLNISVSSHHRCVVCREDMNSTCTVPDEDRDLLFMQSNIFIPKGSRCCPDHVVDGRLINDDLNKIRPREIMQISFSSTDILTWLGISNKVLTTIFQFSNPKAVSRTLAAVRQAMLTHFVPYYLGFNHISRQEVIDNHSSPLATQLLTDKPNTVVLVIDAAYGPYLSDNSNNDAAIQKDILIKNKDGILNWIAEHDLAVVDRGFRDSTGMMRALDLDVCMPDFLNGRHRFDALEANRSCFISKIRWVVESANGRVKHFKWLNQTIQNTTIPQIRDYLQIACALINAYRAPAISSFSNDDQIATKMLAHLHEPNLLRTRLNNEVLRWSKNDASNLVGFPILTIDQIRLITVGIFQLKQARAYSEEHCSTTDLNNQADFPLQTCNTDGQLIRIRFQSRHSNAKSYYTYIQFSTEEVLNSCCDCPIGDRQVGVCAHRAAAIWFLAYQRHQNDISRNQPSGSYLRLLDDSELIDDFVESSDEDDLLYSLS